MSSRARLTLAAAFATLLASTALGPLFSSGGWFVHAAGAVLVVALTGLATRRAGLPRLLQPLVALVVATYYVLLTSLGSDLAGGLVPDGHTLDALRVLVTQGRADVQEYAPPVPTTRGFLLFTTAAVAGIAVVVDALAVVLQRAAIAGLGLLALYAVPSAVLPGGLPWWPFALGAAGWLVLLLAEGAERVDRWGTPMRGHGTRRGDESSLGRVGRRIGAAALGLAVLVPALVPGLDHRLVGGHGGSGTGSGSGSHNGTTFNPITRLQSQLTERDPKTQLTYRVKDAGPDYQPDYLRLTTLDTYDNGEWKASTLRADSSAARVQKGIPVDPDVTVAPQAAVTTDISIGSLKTKWLPVPFGPTKVKPLEGTWLWSAASDTVFSALRDTQGLDDYTVASATVQPTRDELEAAPDTVPANITSTYGTSLDGQTDDRVQALTDTVTKAAVTPFDKAVAIQDYFSPLNGFTYTLTPSLDPQAPLASFLLDKRAGFCQQYATAMAVMLRHAGIPSRVSVGFTPGVLQSNGSYVVTSANAHAWPEGYFAGVGWVRFEPTPSDGQPNEVSPAYTLAATSVPGDGTSVAPKPTQAASPVPSASQLVRDPDIKPSASPLAGGTGGSGGSSFPVLGAVLPVGLVVLLLLPLALTLGRRRQRTARGDIASLWLQLREDASDTGFAWRRNESPRAAAARLVSSRRLGPGPAAALERVASAAERSRYAPSGTAVSTDGLLDDVALLRRTLREEAPAGVRWRATLLPPSTLSWAAEGIGVVVGAVMGTIDEVFGAAGRAGRAVLTAVRPRRA